MPLTTKPEHEPPDERALAAYVGAVAAELDVPVEDTVAEVSEVATAEIPLAERSPEHPDRDLLLIWDNRHGWQLTVESGPSGALTEVAALSENLVPTPEQVAAFVVDVVAGRAARPVPRTRIDDPLTELLERYAD
ncbi:DUF6292 family protein [Amycolatopsis tolypomycina]|uniref:DUF6292 family protein n=1 Tax=Amycolatopsis tolypomycina TaxID=208445 RepID=UPI0033AEC21B